MFKRLLKTMVCVVAAVSVVATGTLALADNIGDSELIAFSTGMGIMNGYPDGTFGLDNNVSRGEFAKMAVSASKYKNSTAGKITVSPFSDVPYYHWAAPYVRVASVNGFVAGYLDATFKPDNNVLCEEAVTVALKMLGYTNEDFGTSWPYGQMNLAAELDLTDGVDAMIGEYMTRRDVAQLMYNLMGTNVKGSNSKYVSQLNYELAENVVLMSSEIDDAQKGTYKVTTSVGTYKSNVKIDASFVGRNGDVIIKDGNTIAAFVPYGDNVNAYVVYSQVDGAVVTYKNGALSQINIDNSDVAYYNSSKTTFGSVKSNLAMGDVIYVKQNSSGNIEYVSIQKGNLQGPYTVRTQQWHTAFSGASDAAIMRDGVKVNAEDIKTYDIAYYSADLNMIFAYSKKVTGIYQSASPNTDNPSSITVSGTEYKLESASAFNAVSSSGSFRPGDTVTLLMGRGGDVADVIDPNNSEESVIGYLTGYGKKEFTNINGEQYTSDYITVVLVDGTENEYITGRSFANNIGEVVQISFKDGVATANVLKARTGVSGTVSNAKGRIGDTPVADNVKIIDVAKADDGEVGAWSDVFFQRIDGIELREKQILYYETNSAGEITSLILNDVTGDAYQYGIVTRAETSVGETSISGRYTINIDGKTYSHNLSAVYTGIATGYPVKVVMNGGSVDSIYALPTISTSISDITSTYVKSGDKTYTISPDVSVFKKTYDYQYLTAPFSDVTEHSKGNMSVFFDKNPDDGGQVRVIVLR